jgi:signal transduction histidine kinase
MDGRLTVNSKEGEGSTFVVELPLAAAPAPEPDAPAMQHA